MAISVDFLHSTDQPLPDASTRHDHRPLFIKAVGYYEKAMDSARLSGQESNSVLSRRKLWRSCIPAQAMNLMARSLWEHASAEWNPQDADVRRVFGLPTRPSGRAVFGLIKTRGPVFGPLFLHLPHRKSLQRSNRVHPVRCRLAVDIEHRRVFAFRADRVQQNAVGPPINKFRNRVGDVGACVLLSHTAFFRPALGVAGVKALSFAGANALGVYFLSAQSPLSEGGSFDRKLIYVGVTLAAFYGLSQFWGWDPLWGENSPHSTTPDFDLWETPIFLSTALVLVLPMGFQYVQTAKTRRGAFWPPWRCWCTPPPLLATLTRSSWLGALAGLAVYFSAARRAGRGA